MECSHCAGLLDWGRRKLLLEGAPAARGGSIGGGGKLLWKGAPVGSSGYTGLLDRGREEVASGGAPDVRGCFFDRGREEAASGVA